VWRRRQCQECGATFTTEERAQYDLVWRVRTANGTVQPFSRPKLFLSLYKSCEHRKTALSDAESLTETVIAKLRPLLRDGSLERSDISRVALVALNRFDKAASVHYQAFHKV
jgi:transcriptional regulator NrdR family protein